MSPFTELKSSMKMRQLISHFKHASLQDVNSLDIEFEEYLRNEMFQITTLEDIDKLRATAERVVKLEYILLKEKSKMHLVSQYVDTAIEELENEKEEYRLMKHKYEGLIAMEKDMHKAKIDSEERNSKFRTLLVDYKVKISEIFDNFQEMIKIK